MAGHEPASPRLSIGLPVRNGERHLGRALDSLLGQDYTDFELVISDNASDDATPDICREAARQDSRVRYHRNETNLGLVANFNRVVSLSAGELFKWATHDDWCEPTFLTRCVAALDDDPTVLLACSAVEVHDEHGEVLGTWQPPRPYAGARAWRRCHRLLWTLGETYPVFGVVRRRALPAGDPMGAYLGADRVLLAELVLRGGIAVDPRPLYHYTYYRPVERTYSVYNDPTAQGKVQLRTWRLAAEHVRAARHAPIPAPEKLAVGADAVVRFGIRDFRRLAAETWHAGRAAAHRIREPAR